MLLVKTSLCNGGVYSPSDWDETSSLRLMDGITQAPMQGWSGTVYKFAIHSSALSLTEIKRLHKTSFPNSRPIAYAAQLSIRENGEDGDHSMQPEFYDHPIQVQQLVQLAIQVSDVDDESPSPLFQPMRGALTRLQLTSLPGGGTQLYYLNGTRIDHTPAFVPRDSNGGFAVRVRPPLDAHSVGTEPLFSFTFRAVDGLLAALFSDEAVISVTVIAVNKPPVPIRNASSHPVISNVITILPAFTGVDADGVLVAAGIAALPTHGLLYDVTLAGIAYPSPLIMPTDGSPYRLRGYRVAYRHTGSQAGALDKNGAFGTESFSFVVFDSDGLASRSERCSVLIHTALRAIPAKISLTTPAILRNQPSLLTLGGTDISGRMDRNLFVRILRFPSTGILYASVPTGLTGASTPFTVGIRLRVNSTVAPTPISGGLYASGAPLYYHGAVFSVPRQTADMLTPEVIASSAPDSFEYEIFTADGARSLPVTQVVEVRNVNNPTELRFVLDTVAWPAGHVRIHATGLVPADGLPVVASITGFNFTDEDLGADLVRVRVESKQGGKMGLDASALKHLIFNGPLCTGYRWQCKGSGDSDVVMDFLATPYWAEAALNGLTYRSTKENHIDNITISVYDGAGANCLDDTKGSASLRIGCFMRMLSLEVEVISFAKPPEHAPKEVDTSLFSLFFKDRTSLLISVAVIIVLCCIAYRGCRWLRVKVRAKYASKKKPPASPGTLEKGTPDTQNTKHSQHCRLRSMEHELRTIGAIGKDHHIIEHLETETASETSSVDSRENEPPIQEEALPAPSATLQRSDVDQDKLAYLPLWMSMASSGAVLLPPPPPPPPRPTASCIEARRLAQPPPPPPRQTLCSGSGGTGPTVHMSACSAKAMRRYVGEDLEGSDGGISFENTYPTEKKEMHYYRAELATKINSPPPPLSPRQLSSEWPSAVSGLRLSSAPDALQWTTACSTTSDSAASSQICPVSASPLSTTSSPPMQDIAPNPLTHAALMRAHHAAAAWRRNTTMIINRRTSVPNPYFLQQLSPVYPIGTAAAAAGRKADPEHYEEFHDEQWL
jgi:hypothetical protein